MYQAKQQGRNCFQFFKPVEYQPDQAHQRELVRIREVIAEPLEQLIAERDALIAAIRSLQAEVLAHRNARESSPRSPTLSSVGLVSELPEHRPGITSAADSPAPGTRRDSAQSGLRYTDDSYTTV